MNDDVSWSQVELPLFLTNYDAVKTYGGAEV
jgi:hypothetical protein